MGEVLVWLGGAALVAALILNGFLIRLAYRQLANADLEEERLGLEIKKIKTETLYLRKKIGGDQMIR